MDHHLETTVSLTSNCFSSEICTVFSLWNMLMTKEQQEPPSPSHSPIEFSGYADEETHDWAFVSYLDSPRSVLKSHSSSGTVHKHYIPYKRCIWEWYDYLLKSLIHYWPRWAMWSWFVFRFSLFVFRFSFFVIRFSFFAFRFSLFVFRFSFFVIRFSIFVFRFWFFVFWHSKSGWISYFDIQNPILTFKLRPNIVFWHTKSYFDIRTGAEYRILTFKILFWHSKSGRISYFNF